MIVLDADSTMAGETLLRVMRAVEATAAAKASERPSLAKPTAG